MAAAVSPAELAQEIAMLGQLPRAKLVERWRALCRSEPPKGISTRLLVRAAAYQVQAKRYGRLRPRLRRQLHAIAANETPGALISRPKAVSLAPGTRLVREWNGSTHVVDVTEGGYRWNGGSYRSLSAVARAITGARWSGPRFFGLG